MTDDGFDYSHDDLTDDGVPIPRPDPAPRGAGGPPSQARPKHPFEPGGLGDQQPPAGPVGNDTDDIDLILPVVYADTIFAKLDPIQWLCRALGITRGRPVIFSGFGDAGKTWAAQEMLLAIACGRRKAWGSVDLGLEGPVIHLDFEQQLSITSWRYQRLAYALGINGNALEKNLAVVSLPPLTLVDPRAEAALIKRCTGRVVALVDNLCASCPGVDENSSAIAAPLYMLGKVSAVTGCLILVIHHESKASETPRPAAQRMRGSSAIHAALGGAVSFVKQADGIISVEQTKATMGTSDGPVLFRLVDVGDIDPDTEKSRGLLLDWVPQEELNEKLAEKRAAAEENREAKAARELEDQILRCIANHPGIAGAEPMKKLGLKPHLTKISAAILKLDDEGRIHNRGGAPPKAHWYVGPEDASRGDQ